MTKLVYYLFYSTVAFSAELKTKLCGFGKYERTEVCQSAKTVFVHRQDAGYFADHHVIVSDGVGSWSREGINSGFYSGNLTKFAADVSIKKICETETEIRDRWDAAHHKISTSGIQGSTTVVEVNFCNSTNKAHIVNLGDSKIGVFRGDKVIYKTESQQHRFNAPYQFSSKSTSKTSSSDMSIYEIQLQKNDIIVTASDGLWDNLFVDQVLELIVGIKENEITKVVQKLLDEATRISFSKNEFTPYAKNRNAYILEKYGFSMHLGGGKEDDTTVAISVLL